MNRTSSLARKFSLVLFASSIAGCIINEGGGDDDGDDDAMDTDPGDADAPSDGPSDADDDPMTPGPSADDTGAPAGDGPDSGAWVYADSGASSNDCTFLGTPSQGLGDYQVINDGGDSFTIVPGDDTDPFDCDLVGAEQFECPQRLVDVIEEDGVAALLEVTVRIEGTTDTTAMEGSQLGSITCTGADCDVAEQLLATSLPCAFEIPFTGTKT